MPAIMSARSGRQIDLKAPSVDAIDLGDIAHSLSHQCRFAGHVSAFYSVAQHAVVVADLVRQALDRAARSGDPGRAYLARLTPVQAVQRQRQALHHDDAEAYIGDLITPLKALCFHYNRLERDWGRVIALKFDLLAYAPGSINHYDRLAAAIEAYSFFDPVPDWVWPRLGEDPDAVAAHGPIKAWSSSEARLRFLERHEQLLAELREARAMENPSDLGRAEGLGEAGATIAPQGALKPDEPTTKPPTRVPRSSLDPYPNHAIRERR